MPRPLALAVMVGLLAGCSSGHNPTAPSPPAQSGPPIAAPPAPARTVRSWTLDVPATIPVGQTRPSRATVGWSDGTSEDVTERVAWRSSFSSVASIDERSGVITGLRVGDTQIYIETFDGRSLQSSSGGYPAAPRRTVVELGPLDLRIVAPENGATLRLARTNGDLSDRLMELVGTLPAEWLSNPTARVWFCFNNRPGYRIVGACDWATAGSSRRIFRPYLSANDPYHVRVGETDRVTAYLTVGVTEAEFYRLAGSGDQYQRSENDPAIVRMISKPLRVTHR